MHLGWKLFNLPELAQDLKDCFVQVVDSSLKLKVDYLFVVGDLFDSNRPSPDLIKFVSEQVERLKANGIIVAGIAGDHDKPVNSSAWVHLTGIIPVNNLSGGRFVGYDYSDNSADNIVKIGNIEKKGKVEWIFLHGQVPQLFPFCEDKKKLDLKAIDIIKDFPNLKGVILGDVHKPYEGVIADPAQKRKPEPYIGYCGSLGVIKTDEIGTKEGLLFYDGEKLSRIPFSGGREFIKLNLADSLTPINWVIKYQRFFRDNKGKKPLFIVEYDKDTKDKLPEANPLYEVGIVRTSVTRKTGVKDKEETINIRSELKTNERIEQTLRICAPEELIYNLTHSLLTNEDPKSVLDAFKQKILNENDKTAEYRGEDT